jgi:uncharacterized protein (TIGR02453 family)
MINAASLQFLYELSQNNNKDWFDKNKPRYEADLKKPWEDTVGAIIERVKTFEPALQSTAKESIPRIYRDTRFSTNKSPYKTNVAAIINPGGKKAVDFPGYYIHLEFGNLMIGGGAYQVEKEPLHRIRTAIAQDPETFMEILHAPDFVTKFGEIKGEQNKVLPPEFKELKAKYPVIANKQFYFMAEMDPETALRPDFPEYVADYCKASAPLVEFLRKAILL